MFFGPGGQKIGFLGPETGFWGDDWAGAWFWGGIFTQKWVKNAKKQVKKPKKVDKNGIIQNRPKVVKKMTFFGPIIGGVFLYVYGTRKVHFLKGTYRHT